MDWVKGLVDMLKYSFRYATFRQGYASLVVAQYRGGLHKPAETEKNNQKLVVSAVAEDKVPEALSGACGVQVLLVNKGTFVYRGGFLVRPQISQDLQ